MPSPLLWFRLPRGRVWHVAASGALVALCGQSLPERGERQPKRPPLGGRPCPECDGVSAKAWQAFYTARAHLPTPSEEDGAHAIEEARLLDVSVDVVTDPKGTAVVDLVAALRSSIEAAKLRRTESAVDASEES